MTNKPPYNILFICTHNRCRSIIAEAITNTILPEKFTAYSAGSNPDGNGVHPKTIEHLKAQGYDTDSLRSKDMLEFTQPDAPVMDFIIKVCDQSRGEACPVWPGQPVTAHWGMADPSTITDETEQQRAFSQVQHQFVNRIRLLDSLPIEKLDKLALTKQVKDIAEQTTIVADTE